MTEVQLNNLIKRLETATCKLEELAKSKVSVGTINNSVGNVEMSKVSENIGIDLQQYMEKSALLGGLVEQQVIKFLIKRPNWLKKLLMLTMNFFQKQKHKRNLLTFHHS
jgi:hypothetical protein